MGKPLHLILTCEHATNRLPKEYRPFFKGREALLESHRGYDPGALELAKKISAKTGAPLFSTLFSRLLIEVNRSIRHPKLFSEITKPLPDSMKQSLIIDYYLPHRRYVENEITRGIHRNPRVLHVGVHSFTPVLDGEVRKGDIGLLYNPSRSLEKEFCRQWKHELHSQNPNLLVRFNYPYLGKADGFTTTLRRVFSANHYLGIEIEVNQKFVGTPEWKKIQTAIVNSLREIIKPS